MRKYLWLLLLPVLFFLIARFALVSPAEYTETGSCYRNGSKLSPEEMRAQTIQSLLTAEMEFSAEDNKYDTWVQTFLIRKSLKSSDVLDAVISKSIVNLPQMAVYPLNTKEDIAVSTQSFLEANFRSFNTVPEMYESRRLVALKLSMPKMRKGDSMVGEGINST